jgi:uncharacterized membrane protein YedE/YeeE
MNHHLKTILFAFASGLIFGLGLILAGMANPAKVLGFLDVAGTWDPSLAFVMAGAIMIGFVAFLVAKKRTQSFLGLPMQMPTNQLIDKRLVLGSTLFGIGWGLVGICPGPGIVLLGVGEIKGLVFVSALVLGVLIFRLIDRSR